MTNAGTGYIGRFAPSPTGPLHFGSLVSALASFLDARCAGGRWLVRMEDLDPPREQPGAADAILRSLDAHGLHWDGAVSYQSLRQPEYIDCLERLLERQLAYPCRCSRRDIAAMGGIYDERCRRGLEGFGGPTAVRLKVTGLPTAEPGSSAIDFVDLFQGHQRQDLGREVGDFIIRRKDGLFAYQLAVVVDDIDQCITHIIRGSDLLSSTPRQIFLYQLLDGPIPKYGHVPLITNRRGQKLSKQTGAAALEDDRAGGNIYRALQCLRQSVPAELESADPQALLDWGTQHWQRQRVPACLELENPNHEPKGQE
ncbi:tRNA glutamyl-Q(34) synthetase GluQRS [Exilibacterium tricleocarpae]|uniref:Glutamyl-Q tRNA(Asp) synthetase n=1 Tax=Exilibacterium tricleocarpae TaxID=2591008 RepID=A0A545STK3_9GAMM|nr:tRNA glutamyl-Q(34) synthetase GluQRS [Exilibacterium tricleocarpae]TQV68293.1 tRNA glutamyl-Q(34) synthetase GluQRS [Exilibacterium tricleocarpae]